jgi:hypothetical protein
VRQANGTEQLGSRQYRCSRVLLMDPILALTGHRQKWLQAMRQCSGLYRSGVQPGCRDAGKTAAAGIATANLARYRLCEANPGSGI